MAQHEAKYVKSSSRVGDPMRGVVPSGRALPAGPTRGAPGQRSTGQLVLLWVGLVTIIAAIFLALAMVPGVKPRIVELTSLGAPGEPDPVPAAAAGEESGGEVEGPEAPSHDEQENVVIPDEVQPELPDADEEVFNQPASLPEGVTKVEASPVVDVGSPKLETVEADSEWVLHKVAPQESVDQIAYRYDVAPQMLRVWNGIKPEKNKLRRGARVKVRAKRIVPPRRRVEYIVQPGDTWTDIAVSFGIDVRDVREQNWEVTKSFYAGRSLILWIDPLVYYWIKYDRGDAGSDDPMANVRRGAVGVGPPQSGRLINGVQIPEGEGFTRRMMPSSYGTTHAVTSLLVALREFENQWPYAPDLVLGSMSAKHGGPLEGHKSHQSGRDLDIRLPMKASVPGHYPVTPERIDNNALWFLLTAFADTGEVTVVFLDYEIQKQVFKAAAKLGVPEEQRRQILQWPRGAAAHRGLVRHAPGHDKHIHVRFRCGPYETECVERGGATGDEEGEE